MKAIKYLLASVILFGFCAVYGQFYQFSLDKKGDVKVIRENRYYPIENHQLSSGYYVWNESEEFDKTGKSIGHSFETEGVKVPIINYQYKSYDSLERNYHDPLWKNLSTEKKKQLTIISLDTIVFSSAKPNKKDEKGNVVEANFQNKDGELIAIENLMYDENNNCIERKKIDADNKLLFTVNYIYLYDNHGNWISQIVLLNGNLYCVNVREIYYY